MTKKIDITTARSIIEAGGVIGAPTEAVFGLSCDPDNDAAIDKILKLKNRKKDKGLILVAADFLQLVSYIAPLDDEVLQRMLGSWPGPHTWLVPAKEEISDFITGKFSTVAVRVSDHPLMVQLCRACGKPLISTSANIADNPAAKTADEVIAIFKNNKLLDAVVDGEVGDSNNVSSIRDAITGKVYR